jgi:hypothetical protein
LAPLPAFRCIFFNFERKLKKDAAAIRGVERINVIVWLLQEVGDFVALIYLPAQSLI